MTERPYTVSEIDALRKAVYARRRQGGYSYTVGSDGRPTAEQSERDHRESLLVEEQVRTYLLAGITAEQFLDSLTGDSLEQAGDALLEEIINFFPQKRRETLRKILATAKRVQDRAAELIDEKLESGAIMQSLEKHLNPSSGNAPASVESIPATSRSGS